MSIKRNNSFEVTFKINLFRYSHSELKTLQIQTYLKRFLSLIQTTSKIV